MWQLVPAVSLCCRVRISAPGAHHILLTFLRGGSPEGRDCGREKHILSQPYFPSQFALYSAPFCSVHGFVPLGFLDMEL